MNENEKDYIENPEPDWSLLMFWEDITAIVQKIGELFKSLINAIFG